MGSSVVPQYGVLKKVHKNQLCVLTYSQPLSPQVSVIFGPTKPFPSVSLQWHFLIFPQSLVNQHQLLQLHKEFYGEVSSAKTQL